MFNLIKIQEKRRLISAIFRKSKEYHKGTIGFCEQGQWLTGKSMNDFRDGIYTVSVKDLLSGNNGSARKNLSINLKKVEKELNNRASNKLKRMLTNNKYINKSVDKIQEHSEKLYDLFHKNDKITLTPFKEIHFHIVQLNKYNKFIDDAFNDNHILQQMDSWEKQLNKGK